MNRSDPAPEKPATRPRLFIEEGFPVRELGIESVRESAPIPGQFPKLKTLHVWWARRPLVASAGAILGSLLPAWTEELAEQFLDHSQLATAKDYREWFLYLCGVWGDPIAARKRIAEATDKGVILGAKAYGYKQAFKNIPTSDNLDLLHEIVEETWGRIPSVTDPTAGGGSIPFKALRYGMTAHANDLNPIAAGVLRAGVELPARYGVELCTDLEHWGRILADRLNQRLSPYFRLPDVSDNNTYIFARTVACPRTGKAVPLVGDWSLRRGNNPVAVRLVTHREGIELDEPEYQIVEGSEIDFHPKDTSTYSRGKGVSPWDGLVIDGNYIRAEAQAGRMGDVLYAVAVRTPQGRGFRTPTETDRAALAAAEAELERLLPRWEQDDGLPTETVPEGNKTRELLNYGMTRWRDLFTPRQLLVHGCFVEEYHNLIEEVQAAIPERERANAVLALLAMMQGKAVCYNSRQVGWNVNRQAITQAFAMHAFPFKKTFAEFEGGRELFPWCLRQLINAYLEIAYLLSGVAELPGTTAIERQASRMKVTRGNAGNMPGIPARSFELVCIDPPYYDNVMYAELSDYFYVWEKRTIGRIWPEFFDDELTNKRDEAVKNKARFAAMGRRADELAHNDYQFKMQAIFEECRRILRDEGAMCVMFTHKAIDAWNGLGASLLDAGFTIESSWPMNTESPSSLHQARKNSVKSTIFLVCRKRPDRPDQDERVYLSEIEAEIRAAAGDALHRAAEQRLSGVDLLLSTYGPALSVLSRHWPVYSAETDEEGRSRRLRPEEALDIAQAEVTRRQLIQLVGHEVDFDPFTNFTLAAWNNFRARQFPFDDARRLALAAGGLDLKELERAKLVRAKAGNVTVLKPHERLRRDGDEDLPGVNRSRSAFAVAVDAVHTALYITDLDGLGAAKHWLDQRGLTNNSRFTACLQALVRAIPRTKTRGEWNLPEAELLDDLVNTYFPDIDVPPDPGEDPEQLAFGDPSDG